MMGRSYGPSHPNPRRHRNGEHPMNPEPFPEIVLQKISDEGYELAARRGVESLPLSFLPAIADLPNVRVRARAIAEILGATFTDETLT